MVLSLHIGAGFEVIRRPQEAPVDHLMVLACQISAITAQDLLFGPTLRKFPDLQVGAVRGRHRLDPLLLRPRSTATSTNQTWLHGGDEFGGKLPSEVFREHFLACFITDPSGLRAARPHRHGHHRLGVRLPPHRHHVAELARVQPGRSSRTRAAPTSEIHKITWENACRFFDWDPFQHTKREDSHRRRPALRAQATDVDTTRMPRAEWKKQNEAAGIGVLATSAD